jgi:hypothetical protein
MGGGIELFLGSRVRPARKQCFGLAWEKMTMPFEAIGK